MLISIEPKRFVSELYKLLGVTSSKGPMAVVSHALLTANSDNTLTLEATDLEVTIRTTMDCNVEQPGQLCLGAHNLHSVIKGMVSPKAQLSGLENSWAQLKSEHVDCRIVGVSPVDFPRLPIVEELDLYYIETECLLDMIERTIISVSTDEARPNLTGGFLSMDDHGQLVMVSTDGHRLSKVVRTVEVQDIPEELEKGVIIPRKSLTELKRTLDLNVPRVGLAIKGNNAVFQFGRTTIMVRLVDSSFPDYQRVIPEQSTERQAIIVTEEFNQKLKFVSLFASPRTNNLTVSFEEDLLELSASDPDRGEGKEFMKISYNGPQVQVGFNYKYLLEVLSVLSEDHFRFQIMDTFSASLILDGERTDDLFLIMPMRL